MSSESHLASIDGAPSAGEHRSAIARCEETIERLCQAGPHGISSREGDRLTLKEVGAELGDLLRWERRYREAIALQHRLAEMLPENGAEYRTAAATFCIEAGDIDEGLRQLAEEANKMEPAAGNLLLGSTFAWLQNYVDAETHLRAVAEAGAADPADRAAALHLLFHVLAIERRMPEAESAWEAACAIAPDLVATRPAIIRAHIYWYDYSSALRHIELEPSEFRRSFYRTLVATRTAPGLTPAEWDWISGQAPGLLDTAHEEFAEAAMRNLSPQLALDTMQPFLERNELSRHRLLLTGIAWAQQRKLERAQWALTTALRLAEFERPRRTRPGAGKNRIFDAEARITYGEIPIDTDVRSHLDPYFMPKPQLN
jgi:hypothetical protein